MTDRVLDVWGPRTPHERGSDWPVRIDQHLTADDVDRWVPSACVLCSNGCGCEIAVKDGRMVGVRGRADDRVNHGRLGPKGLYGSTPWASSPDRLTRPLVREGAGLVETDWETARGRRPPCGTPRGRARRRNPGQVTRTGRPRAGNAGIRVGSCAVSVVGS